MPDFLPYALETLYQGWFVSSEIHEDSDYRSKLGHQGGAAEAAAAPSFMAMQHQTGRLGSGSSSDTSGAQGGAGAGDNGIGGASVGFGSGASRFGGGIGHGGVLSAVESAAGAAEQAKPTAGQAAVEMAPAAEPDHSKEELATIRAAAEAESKQLKEDLARAQDALLQIQQSKEDAEKVHAEAMELMHERVLELKEEHSDRLKDLEVEVEAKSEHIGRLTAELTELKTVLNKLVAAKEKTEERSTTWSEYNLLNQRMSGVSTR
eukprot:SAG11_NODE_266_length_11468_cov_11.519222_4_plen_263_part_00